MFSVILLLYFSVKLYNFRHSYSQKDILVNELIWYVERMIGHEKYTNFIKNNDTFGIFNYINDNIFRISKEKLIKLFVT